MASSSPSRISSPMFSARRITSDTVKTVGATPLTNSGRFSNSAARLAFKSAHRFSTRWRKSMSRRSDILRSSAVMTAIIEQLCNTFQTFCDANVIAPKLGPCVYALHIYISKQAVQCFRSGSPKSLIGGCLKPRLNSLWGGGVVIAAPHVQDRPGIYDDKNYLLNHLKKCRHKFQLGTTTHHQHQSSNLY